MSPYEKVLAALKHLGFLKFGKPTCPTCPPHKRRGFDVTEAKTRAGLPSVVIHCFRGCDTLADIVPALGLDPADLFDGGQRTLFDAGRYCRVTTQGWKALARGSARTFGIASSVGFYPSVSSSYTLLRTGKQWDALRREAEVEERHLRRDVDDWTARLMAHRCEDRTILALYRAPFDRCPNCGRLTLENPRHALMASNTTRKYAQNGRNKPARRHAPDTTLETVVINPQSGRDLPGERGGAT